MKVFFHGEIPGIPGHEYIIEVSRNGKDYLSSCRMSQPSRILSLDFQWIKMPYDYVAVLQVTFTDPIESSDDCYWIRLYRNGNSYMWLLSDDRKSVDGITNEVTMTSRRIFQKKMMRLYYKMVMLSPLRCSHIPCNV